MLSQTEVAALLERHYQDIDNLEDARGFPLDEYGLKGFKILECGEFAREEYKSQYPEAYLSNKALVVQDADGNIYVHYRGTADGNWPYNSVAYGPQNGKTTSPVQDWALKYFEQVVAKYYIEEGYSGKLFVSGHSQGANNAQFVTMRSQYGDYIERCTSLDGPGFSHDSVEETKRICGEYGDGVYERQRDKIYAFNGEYDYVSCLGQEQIVQDDHVRYIKYDYENYGLNPGWFHGAEGLFYEDEDGIHLGDYTSDCSDFRKLVLALNERILTLPEDQQAEMAVLVMALCENLLGENEPVKVALSQEDVDKLVHLLAPVLADAMDEDREIIISALESLGLETWMIGLADSIMDALNKLSPELRAETLEILLKCLILDDDGSSFKARTWPILKEIFNNPEYAAKLLDELGLTGYFEEHPAAIAAFALALAGLVLLSWTTDGVLCIKEFIDRIIDNIPQWMKDLGNGIWEFVVQVFNAVKEAIGKLAQWARNNFNAGVKYANNNPYIKADTVSLREYAERVRKVNNRLNQLDQDLRSLYWQVGLLDIWDILVANLLTSQSYALNRVKEYLNYAADSFETADRTAADKMGG